MLHLFYSSSTLLYFSSSIVGRRTSNKTTVTRNQNGQTGAILWQCDCYFEGKKRISHLSKKKVKKKPFPQPKLFWRELVADLFSIYWEWEKELWRCCAADDVCYQRFSICVYPSFDCGFHSWGFCREVFFICSHVPPAFTYSFFLYNNILASKESFTISLLFTIIRPSVIYKDCVFPPDDDHANKELDDKMYSDFFSISKYFAIEKTVKK